MALEVVASGSGPRDREDLHATSTVRTVTCLCACVCVCVWTRVGACVCIHGIFAKVYILERKSIKVCYLELFRRWLKGGRKCSADQRSAVCDMYFCGNLLDSGQLWSGCVLDVIVGWLIRGSRISV